MGSQLSPYLGCNGNAWQAMAYSKLMHARLDTPGGSTPMAWDVPAGAPDHPGSNVAVYLGGDDGEPRGSFATLSAGGTVTMPLEPQAWGDEAGALVDRFGITRMATITR